jgi:site-specific DNA recombinase
MASQAVRTCRGRRTASSLLTGILFDRQTENRLTPSHAVKDGKRYRYYVTATGGREAPERTASDHWRIPAVELDSVVINATIELLRTRAAWSTCST